jgi:DinB family protein
MHPRIEELIAYIDTERVKLREAVDSVPAERRRTPPTPESWSVAQVVEHLAVTERRITAMFRKNVADAKAAGLANETETSSQPDLLKPDQFADRSKKIVGPSAVSPSSAVDTDTAWTALESARSEFRAAVLEADGFALNDLKAPHPAFGPMTLYHWISFVGGHDARHAKQIREIDETLASRSA